MSIQIHEVEQGTEVWAELRAGKYTGSNAHKLIRHGAIDYSLTAKSNFRGNFWTKRGHILEAEAIELYQQIKKIDIVRPGFVTNDKYPKCGYSPDGLAENLMIEVKCFDIPKHLQLSSGDLPFEVLAQIHYGMFICEMPLTHLIAYNPELDARAAFKIIPIKANRNIAANIKRILNS